MRRLFFLGFLLCLLLPNFSCRKKGCTDEKALNYNITANSDDGTCLYCEEKVEDRGGLTVYIVDTYTGSEHYNQQILRVNIAVTENTYNDLSCGDGIPGCRADITFTSLISKSMTIDFYVSIDLQTGWSWYYDYQSNLGITIPGGQSVAQQDYITNLSLCSEHSTASAYYYLYSANYF